MAGADLEGAAARWVAAVALGLAMAAAAMAAPSAAGALLPAETGVILEEQVGPVVGATAVAARVDSVGPEAPGSSRATARITRRP